MADKQDNMTPEEKLLNVIQSGGEEAASPEEKLAVAAAAPEPVPAEAPLPIAAEAAPVAAEAAPVAEDAAPAEAKPALKLAAQKKEAKPKAGAKGGGVAAESPLTDAGIKEKPAAAPAIAFSKKKPSSGAGITVINRMLAAGIIILLGLSGFETFRVIKVRGAVRKPVSLQVPAAVELTITAEDVKNAYSVDPWWKDPGLINLPTEGPTEGPQGPRTAWTEDMKNFKLMGVSMKDPKPDSEAILMDTRDNRMYFVRLGDSLSVAGVEVKLDDLEPQRARFTDGRASVELK